MIVKLLTEHHLEVLNLKGGCRGSSESTHVKIQHCWKSHALAHICDSSREKGRVGCHIVKFTFFRFLNRKFYDESRNINMLVDS